MATITDIAKGVVEALAEYGAELSYNPDFELRKMTARRVVVVPVAKRLKMETRADNDLRHTINVAVIHKCRSDADIEPLIAMAETIGAALLRIRVAGETCTAVEWNPLYGHEEMRDKGQFTSVITATFVEVCR